MSNRFLSPAHFAAIRQRIDAGDPTAAAGSGRLLADADAVLTERPVSIRQNGGSPYFRQDAVYIPGRDGERNPASNMKSGELAGKLSSASLTLSLAWRLTGQQKYADKALEFIHVWCINQNTLMFPTGRMEDAWTHGAEYGGDIILFAHFHDFFLACHLLSDYPGWSLPARGAVKRWVQNMVEPQRALMFYQGKDMYNNWEDARLLYLAKGALFLDDVELLLYVFDRWRKILPEKMTDKGELLRETMRTRSMHYTLFALESTMQVAEIARQCGEDLYDCTINGKNIKKAVDYAAYYLLHMSEWPFQMIEPLAPAHAHLTLFELAHARWPNATYLQILQMYGGRPIPHSTLLYAKD